MARAVAGEYVQWRLIFRSQHLGRTTHSPTSTPGSHSNGHYAPITQQDATSIEFLSMEVKGIYAGLVTMKAGYTIFNKKAYDRQHLTASRPSKAQHAFMT